MAGARTSTTRTNTVTNVPKSRYTQGGESDKYPTRVGWWERKELPSNDTDVFVTILPTEAGRPDRIAYRVYGKAGLQWLVLQYNAIVDTETELTVGTTLRLPNPRRVELDILSQPTGGNRVT